MPFFLLRKAHFPQYVHSPTRAQVLHLFKNLLVQINRFPDTLARDRLRYLAGQKFTTYKYVTDPLRIDALCEIAAADLDLITSANNGNVKNLKTVLDRAFRTIGVKQSPLRALVPVTEPSIDKTTLAYKFNNLQMPTTPSFKQHFKATPESHLFYAFVHFLTKNQLTSGLNGRKIFLQPSVQYTVLGKPVAPCRQRNILRKTYHLILRDAFRPVHPSVIRHLEAQLTEPNKDRRLRRRLLECAREYYSVDDAGGIVKCRIPIGATRGGSR